MQKARFARRNIDADNAEDRSLDERCLLADASGPPMNNGGYNDNYQFIQTADHLAIVAEYDHDVRIIRFQGSHPPPSLRQWFGDSVGHWEGASLVVETTNFHPLQVGAGPNDKQADMRVIETFKRTARDEVTYTFAVTNPSVDSQTWQGEMVFRRTPQRMFEFACHEGNYALPNILAGARRDTVDKHPPDATR